MSKRPEDMESARLEQFWSGEFGDDYAARNVDAWKQRGPFWRDVLARIDVATVLEVGCNVGANLHWLAQLVPPGGVFGVDVNEEALEQARARVPAADVTLAAARELPFGDCSF